MEGLPDSCAPDIQPMPMFFYGTLMNEHILERVIGRPINKLNIQPAQLSGYCRFKIRDAHYPGLIPASAAEVALKRPPTLEEQTVTGMIVSGLSASDVTLLDAFEGEVSGNRFSPHTFHWYDVLIKNSYTSRNTSRTQRTSS
ncbi:hypothetical protein PGT21_012003 [Puccinia graminis f. sp. tritici]|uniref:Putative gamma-glutamylcyclotransferase n=1 Tax=Puccinia graminis f. sp. tritici TaxID=56615 RepID=A0A5B0M9P6_PUCGR|nr:hypothetical protein PGT21_012003 [Puccinia graminis f. sp. tritici]KAA1122023.1 hypothetical protein PGTUg99_020055 [Puccinia graminis f. sp. tritici]